MLIVYNTTCLPCSSKLKRDWLKFNICDIVLSIYAHSVYATHLQIITETQQRKSRLKQSDGGSEKNHLLIVEKLKREELEMWMTVRRYLERWRRIQFCVIFFISPSDLNRGWWIWKWTWRGLRIWILKQSTRCWGSPWSLRRWKISYN